MENMIKTRAIVFLDTIQDLKAFYSDSDGQLKKWFTDFGIEISSIEIDEDNFGIYCPEIDRAFRVSTRNTQGVGCEFYLVETNKKELMEIKEQITMKFPWEEIEFTFSGI